MLRSVHALNPLLRKVSRSFYLTLRVLPAGIRPQISLAYLLARATDTIADTDIMPLAERLGALEDFRARLGDRFGARLDFSGFLRTLETAAVRTSIAETNRPSGMSSSGSSATDAERVLLSRIEEVFAAMGTFLPADQERIREVLATITSGQELDLRRFGGAPGTSAAAPRDVVALLTDQELDDYTYRVAGCVGEFWTKMCRAHLFPKAPLDDAVLLGKGTRFGQGLQLVNILRDLPADLRKGRCYVPRESLQAIGLAPSDLLDPQNEQRFRPVYNRLLSRAEEHLAAGWDYTNTLPWNHARVRLACAWPLLIGIKTLARLRIENVLDPARRRKMSRAETRGLILRTVVCYLLPGLWRQQFKRIQG